jgi:hypothetical protein
MDQNGEEDQVEAVVASDGYGVRSIERIAAVANGMPDATGNH